MGTNRDDVGGGKDKSQPTRKASFASAAASAVGAAASAAASRVKGRVAEAAEKRIEERGEELKKAASDAAGRMARRASRVASSVATGLHKAYERGMSTIEKIGQAIDQLSSKKIDESIDRVIDQIDTIGTAGTAKTGVGKDIGGASRNALSPTDIETLTEQFVSLVDLTLAKRKMALNGEGKQSAKEFFRRNYDPSSNAKPGQVQALFNQYMTENFPNEERAKRVSVRMSDNDLRGKLKQLEIERDAAINAAAEAQRQLQDMLAGAMKASNDSAGDNARVIQLMQQLQLAQEKLDRMAAGGRSSVRTTPASSSVEAVGVDDKLVKAKKAVEDVLNDPTMKFKGKEELTAAERQAIIEQIGSSVAKMGIDNPYLILNMIVKLKAGGIQVADPSLKTTGGVQERAVVEEERPANPLLEQLKARQAKLGDGSPTTSIEERVRQQKAAAAAARSAKEAAGGMGGSAAFKAAMARRRDAVKDEDDSDDGFDDKPKTPPADRRKPGG